MEQSKQSARWTLIRTAVWLGLITGLVEGTALYLLQQWDVLQGQITFLGASYPVIWIAAFYDALLFLLVGLGFVTVHRFFPRRIVELIAFSALGALTFFAWFQLYASGRLKIYAVAVLALGLGYQFARTVTSRQERFEKIVRKTFPALLLFTVALFGVIQGGMWVQEQWALARLPKADGNAPNILVIVIDTLRADHLSSYGYYRDTDPNISRIAQEGVLFENAFAASNWTVPSHASLLTGRWLHEHLADTNEAGTRTVPLDDTYPTIGEALMQKGYRTAAFSANFETFKSRNGFGRGFIRFEDYYQSLANLSVSSIYGRTLEYYVLHKIFGMEHKYDRRWAPDINDHVLRWIKRDSQHPYFVLINYFDVHSPYVPPEPFRSKYASIENPGGLINTDWSMFEIYVPMTEEQFQGEIDAYDGSIAYVDFHIQNLLENLKASGNLENTLVVITSDHGESFGEHGLLEHHNGLYPEVIRVPLIFWWHGHLPAGVRIEQFVSNAALPATILDLLGDATGQFPGPSLRVLWEDPEAEVEWPYPIAEVTKAIWLPPQHLPVNGKMESVISPEFQIIQHEVNGTELYDLKNDPNLLHNLYGNPAYVEIAEALRSLLTWRLHEK